MQSNNRNKLNQRRLKQTVSILKSKLAHFKGILENRSNELSAESTADLNKLISRINGKYERLQMV